MHQTESPVSSWLSFADTERRSRLTEQSINDGSLIYPEANTPRGNEASISPILGRVASDGETVCVCDDKV